MAKTTIDKKERKKLRVTWVGEPQTLPNSQVQVLRFNADDGLQYETFKQSLFSYIQLDSELDADTELHITQADSGQQYVHWRVVQLYGEDGKPLYSAKTPQKSFGRDEDRTDRRNAIITIKDLWVAGLIKHPNPLTTWLLAELTILTTEGGKDAKSKEIPDKRTETRTNIEPDEATIGDDDSRGDDQEKLPEWAEFLKENISKTDLTNGQWLTWLTRTFNRDFGAVKTLQQAIEQLTKGQQQLVKVEIESRIKK